MAVTATLSNHFLYQRDNKEIDWDADTFKAILCTDSFTFNRDTHATLSDITNQLATNYGYTQNNKTVTVSSVTENDTDDRSDVVIADVSWPASGGDIGPFRNMIVYDDTTSDDTVVGCIDFGVNITIPDGSTFTAKDLEVQSS